MSIPLDGRHAGQVLIDRANISAAEAEGNLSVERFACSFAPGMVADVSSSDFIIRRTNESDWQEVRALRIDNATDNPISYGATLETTLAMSENDWRLRARRGQQDDAISVAAIDRATGRWVGMMSGQIGDDHGPESVLTGVFVTPDWRGRERGLALALLTTVEEWALVHGHALRLFVDQKAVPARRFYDRNGFAVTGRWRPIGFTDGNTVEMIKFLGASADE